MRNAVLASAVLLCLLLAAYSNHFQNSFHFDDFHTITTNPHIRSLSNLPQFFTDSKTFSNLPTHQVYRPVLTSTLAFDYVRSGGRPFAFHVTGFVLFLVHLAVVWLLLVKLTGEVYWSLATVAIYGLHPVSAETVNYIVQRADIMSTLGVVAGLALYAWKPAWRRLGLYLIPVVLALLTKPPALVFPVLLIAYAMIFESRRFGQALRNAGPSLAVCGVMALLLSSMTAATFNSGGASPAQYRITQMYAALYYFSCFLAPVHLSADTDWSVLPGMEDPRALAGLLFLAASGLAIWWTLKRPAWRPVGFGLIWFFVALFPTSWMPLAEVTNDHRMFFPFIGLALAFVWTVRLLTRNVKPGLLTAIFTVVLVVEAWGTYARNEVWRTEETLWHDVTIKSPENGRGLMNYALTLTSQGQYAESLRYLERARTLTPNYFLLEINLAITKAALGRHAEAEQHFLRALQLEPQRYESYFYYARWLNERGRGAEAVSRLQTAVRLNPAALDAKDLLQSLAGHLERAEALARTTPTPENWLALSLAYYNAGRFEDCITAARRAVQLRPSYAEAWNNIAAGYNSLRRWDEGIRAADEALRINPSYELARNNRAWAVTQRGVVSR